MFDFRSAHKLEDPDRPKWMPPEEAVRLLALRPGLTIADIGAGTGFFAIPFAASVSPMGRVFRGRLPA